MSRLTRRELLKGAATLGAAAAAAPALGGAAQAQTTQKRELVVAQGGDAPVLIRIETRAGHGAGKPTTKIIEEVADKWAFLVRVLGGHMDAQAR